VHNTATANEMDGLNTKKQYQYRSLHYRNKVYTGPLPAGGQWCPGPPFEISAPHFTFGPPVAA